MLREVLLHVSLLTTYFLTTISCIPLESTNHIRSWQVRAVRCHVNYNKRRGHRNYPVHSDQGGSQDVSKEREGGSHCVKTREFGRL